MVDLQYATSLSKHYITVYQCMIDIRWRNLYNDYHCVCLYSVCTDKTFVDPMVFPGPLHGQRKPLGCVSWSPTSSPSTCTARGPWPPGPSPQLGLTAWCPAFAWRASVRTWPPSPEPWVTSGACSDPGAT